MTLPTADRRPPVGFVLFGGEDLSSELSRPTAIGGALRDALGRFTPATRSAAVLGAAAIAAGLVTHEPAKLLVLGWSKAGALRQAAHATRDRPGSEEFVEIVRQRISATHRPQVDIVVNGARVASVELGLSVEFVIDALSGSVRAGRLIALRSGNCAVTASLAVQDVVVLTRRTQVQLPLVMHLGAGVPLVPGTEDRGLQPRSVRLAGTPIQTSLDQ